MCTRKKRTQNVQEDPEALPSTSFNLSADDGPEARTENQAPERHDPVTLRPIEYACLFRRLSFVPDLSAASSSTPATRMAPANRVCHMDPGVRGCSHRRDASRSRDASTAAKRSCHSLIVAVSHSFSRPPILARLNIVYVSSLADSQMQ